MNDENEETKVPGSLATALTGLLEKLFSASLVGPALSQLGATVGDQVKSFRVRNLMRIGEQLDEVLADRGLDRSDLSGIAMSVGLPLLEKASYQDDAVLQRRWVNLLASSMQSGGDNDFDLDITFVEILHQFSRLDCEVLKYVVDNGIVREHGDGGMSGVPLDPSEVLQAFPGRLAHISLEKLVTLGCARRVPRTPLTTEGRDSSSGGLAEDVLVTYTGINLYLAAAEAKPAWWEQRTSDTPA